MIKLINGNVQNANGQPLTGSLTLQLTQDATVIASPGTVVSAVPITFQFLNGNLVGTCQVYSNAELTPQTQYTATFKDQNGSRINQQVLWQFTQTAGSTVDIGTMVNLASSPGVAFPSPVIYDVVQGGSLQAGINAKVAAGGGVVNVAPNYTETLAANLVLASNVGIVFWGPATITQGSFQVIISPGVNGLAIKAPATSTLVASPSVQFIYTGNSDAWKVGDSTANTQGLRFENFAIITSSAGSSAVGLHLNRVIASSFHGLSVFGINSGTTSQVGILLDGTGGFTGDNLFTSCIAAAQSSVQFNLANINVFIGGVFSSASTNGIGLDFQNGQGNVVIGADIETTATAINFANSANVTNNQVQAWLEANTTDITFGAASTNNTVDVITGNPKVTGAGAGANNNLVKGAVKAALLNQQGPAGAITGNAADQVIYSFTIPANTVQAGKGIKVTIAELHSTGTTSTTYKLKFGATTFDTFSYGNQNGSIPDVYEYRIYNNAGVQNAQSFLRLSNLNFVGNSLAVVSNATGTGSIDFTQPQTLTWTFNVANTDAVTPKLWSVELIQ